MSLENHIEVLDAATETTMAKPGIPIKAPVRRLIREFPSPLPDNRPVPVIVPNEPSPVITAPKEPVPVR